jgi:transposase
MARPHKKGHEIDTPTKNRLIGFYLATGNAAAAASKENIPPRTAQYIIKRYRQTGSASNKHRSGRPSILTEYDQREIIRTARKNRRMPLTELTNEISAKVSVTTIRRILARQGYHRRVARRVPYLTSYHKRLRLLWGKAYQSWGRAHWRRVIFSDECYVHVGDKCGRIFVTRRKDERLLDECVVPTFKQSKLCIMIWGCIARGRKGPLVLLDYPGGKGGGMNSKRYQQQVLGDVFLDFYTQLKHSRGYVQFQQDSAPAHSSKSTLAWLASHRIPLFFHPPNSPDLNPIEPLWLELKCILQRHSHSPTTIDELKEFVCAAWDEISVASINRHIDHMPDRAASVLRVRGGHTRF